jgi:hypothetical protein
MERLRATQKLFNAIVVMGMATALGCSSGNTPTVDASTDGNDAVDTGGQDAKNDVVADTGGPQNDGGSDADAFSGWLGC